MQAAVVCPCGVLAWAWLPTPHPLYPPPCLVLAMVALVTPLGTRPWVEHDLDDAIALAWVYACVCGGGGGGGGGGGQASAGFLYVPGRPF